MTQRRPGPGERGTPRARTGTQGASGAKPTGGSKAGGGRGGAGKGGAAGRGTGSARGASAKGSGRVPTGRTPSSRTAKPPAPAKPARSAKAAKAAKPGRPTKPQTSGSGGTARSAKAATQKKPARGTQPKRTAPARGRSGSQPARSAASARTATAARRSGTASRPIARSTRPAPKPRPAPKVKVRPPKRPPRRVRLADPRKRLNVSLVGICVLLSLFAGRLVQLQGLDASTYAAAARESNRHPVQLPAQRGDIVDRNGAPLASTVEAYNVTVNQAQVTNPAAYALQLEPLLGVDATTIQRALTGTKPFAYVAKGITGPVWRQVKALGLAGIYPENAASRAYPAGAVGGNVVGFIGSDGEGLAGLEQSRQADLAGADGEAVYQFSPGGQRIPTSSDSIREPVAGTGLRLTLDRDVQWYTEQALAGAVANAGADAGVAVVMKADTQEIVAMASTPVVDPNDPDATPAADRGNKAVEDAYEPGSVFKPLTMAAVIEEGMAGPSTAFSVPDSIERSGETIHDYYNHPEQPMTLAGIVAKSSNVGTVLAAESIDKDTFRDYLEKFGLGSKPGLGLPAETAGNLPDDWSDLTRDNIAFGQGVSVNAVQMASAYATIANGGVRVDPTLVAATIGPDGEETPTDPGTPTRVVSEDTANAVTSLMEAVMAPDGTGKPALVEGYRVAGKTGTAQRVDPACGCYSGYNSSFMGFAPADDPEYVVVVSLMDPSAGNSGGALAGPAFSDIMRFALEQGGVAPSGTEAPRLPLFAE